MCLALQLLKCGDVVLWEVLGPQRFRVHLFRAGLHETDPALRATLPGGARCGPFYAGESALLLATCCYVSSCSFTGISRQVWSLSAPVVRLLTSDLVPKSELVWPSTLWPGPWPARSRSVNTRRLGTPLQPRRQPAYQITTEMLVLDAVVPRSEELEARPSSDAGSPRSGGSVPAGALHSLAPLTGVCCKFATRMCDAPHSLTCPALQ